MDFPMSGLGSRFQVWVQGAEMENRMEQNIDINTDSGIMLGPSC